MTVENLEINIKTSVTGSQSKTIESLADALGKLEAKAAALSGLSNLSALASAMQAISGTRVTASAFNGMAKGIENLSAALKTITTDDLTRLSALANALRSMNNVDLSGLGNASNVSRAARSLHETARGIDDVAQSAKKSQTPINNFIGSLKRIAFYRLLRTIIKEIAQAFREGLENAYEWSKAVGGDLAPALDRIATASAQMKNQLGAALGELIIALEPIIVELIHFVTSLAQALTWLFATLNGKSEFPIAQEIATGWKEADKAAKEYKRTILGFDVINRLNGPGSGGSATDYGTMFSYGNAPTLDFRWENFTPFFKPLDDWTDSTLDALAELSDVLDEIFNGSYELDLGFGWNVNPIPVLEKVKQWLDDLVEDSPYTVAIGLKLGENFREKLSEIGERIAELVNPSPYIIDIGANELPSFGEVLKSIWDQIYEKVIAPSPVMGEIGYEVHSPVPELVAVGDGIVAELMRQADAFSRAYDDITEALNRGATSAESTAESMNRASESVRRHTELQARAQSNAIGTMVTLNGELATNQTLTASEIKRALGSTLNGYTGFAYTSSEYVRRGMENSANYMVEFADITGETSSTWAESVGEVFADWGTATNTIVADTLDEAYANYSEFGKATGVDVPSFKSKRNVIRNAALGIVGIGAAAVVATIAAKALGAGGIGMSKIDFQADGAFASGGFPEAGSLFIANESGPELVGSIGGRTAVANNDQIVEAVSSGVYQAVSSAMGNGNRDISVRVYLDSREIKSGQQRLARATGR